MSKVIVGEGKPRIIVIESSALVTSTVYSLNQSLKLVYFSGSPTLTSAVIGRMLITKNSSDQSTQGKIISFDNAAKYVRVDEFDNGFPATTKEAKIQNTCIDLPFSRELFETFQPVFGKSKTLYHNRKKVKKLLGFYYYASVDYSNYSKASTLALLAPLYSSLRTESLFFYPRSDNKTIFYEVDINDEDFEIAQHIKGQGHKYIKLSFEGLNMLKKIPLDSSTISLGINSIIVGNDTYVVEP